MNKRIKEMEKQIEELNERVNALEFERDYGKDGIKIIKQFGEMDYLGPTKTIFTISWLTGNNKLLEYEKVIIDDFRFVTYIDNIVNNEYIEFYQIYKDNPKLTDVVKIDKRSGKLIDIIVPDYEKYIKPIISKENNKKIKSK